MKLINQSLIYERNRCAYNVHVLAAALCIVAAKVGLVRADYLARYQVPGG